MDGLIRILEREVVILEQVVFRAKTAQLLMASDEHRFLGQGADEVEAAAESLGGLEAMRAVLVEEIAERLGLEEQPTLTDLIAGAKGEERAALRRLQRRLQDLAAEMEAQVAAGRTVALSRIAEIRTLLERLSGTPGTSYGRDGIPETPPLRSGVDRRL